MPDPLYFNGRFTTTDEKVLGVEDRGLQFGDSIYEVLKFLRGRALFLKQHYARMIGGLAELEIPSPWTEPEFASLCRDLLARTEASEGLLYVQITRGEAERVHFWPEKLSPTVIAYPRAFQFPDAVRKERGIAVITMPDARWKSCNLKTTNLLPNVIGKKRAQREGADEAIFLTDGAVTEGASSSFFAVREGKVITHAAEPCILPGTVRDEVISIALEQKIRVDERPVRETELYGLDEAFITSTSQGVMPVTTIDGRTIANGRRGEVTEIVQREFAAREEREAG